MTITPIILHHDKSVEYTKKLSRNLPMAVVYNSSKHQTPFTLSFNRATRWAMEHSEAEAYMICNNDIELSRDQIERMSKMIQEEGIYSPSVNSPHRSVMDIRTAEPMRDVPWLEFVCPIITKGVIDKIGLLDEAMPLGYGVELDYCYRARQAGYPVRLIQTERVHHYGHQSQIDHDTYRGEASSEMHTALTRIYGEDWMSILSYPQW